MISTRILRDANGNSRGVGFARLESKEKCEQIIHIFNGNPLPGLREPLLVKFADGGGKKKATSIYNKSQENSAKMWHEINSMNESSLASSLGYDPNSIAVAVAAAAAQNGVTSGPHLIPAPLSGPVPGPGHYNRSYITPAMAGGYAMTAGGTQWVPQYLMQAATHLSQMDDPYAINLPVPPLQQQSQPSAPSQSHPSAHNAANSVSYKNDSHMARGMSIVVPTAASPDPNNSQYNAMLSQLSMHMSAMQLGSSGSVIFLNI